jgi:hypothetical protein
VLKCDDACSVVVTKRGNRSAARVRYPPRVSKMRGRLRHGGESPPRVPQSARPPPSSRCNSSRASLVVGTLGQGGGLRVFMQSAGLIRWNELRPEYRAHLVNLCWTKALQGADLERCSAAAQALSLSDGPRQIRRAVAAASVRSILEARVECECGGRRLGR